LEKYLNIVVEVFVTTLPAFAFPAAAHLPTPEGWKAEYTSCEVAQAEIRTYNLPTANLALYHTATSASVTSTVFFDSARCLFVCLFVCLFKTHIRTKFMKTLTYHVPVHKVKVCVSV